MIVSARYLTQSAVIALLGGLIVLLTACNTQSDVLGSRAAGPEDGTNSSADVDQQELETSQSDGESPGSGDDQDSESGTELDSASDESATNLSTDPDRVFEPGTCYRSTDDDSEPELVECDTPHDIEVYNVGELPGDDGAPFVGLDQARAVCDPAFRELTGIGIGLATIFDRTVLRPSEETWAQGDRVVTCLAQYPETVTEPLEDIDPVRGFGLVSPYGMEKGDCFVGFEDEASSFNLISCDESHDVEVFVAEALSDGAYPGDDEIEAQADELCFGQSFEDFVGQSYGNSDLFSLRSMPTQNSWDQGDQTINCLLTMDEPRVGSLEGSES